MAKRGTKVRVIRPETKEQEIVDSPEAATKRRVTAGENTSSLYSHIYRASGNGKGRIPPLRPLKGEDGKIMRSFYETIILPWGETRSFRPDVVHRRKTGYGFTEVKAVSTRTSQPHCAVPQVEDYVLAHLTRIEQGDEIPWVDYAFFRYGPHKFNGQHKYENGDLIEKLAEMTRDLTIVPLNLALFIFMNSPEQDRHQESSWTPTHTRSYYDVRSSTINYLQEEDPQVALKEILDNGMLADKTRRYKNAVIDALHLRDLKVTRPEPKPMKTYSGVPITPFRIARFRLPGDEYQVWLGDFFKYHARIMQRLGARDLYQEIQDSGGEFKVINPQGYIGPPSRRGHLDTSFEFEANVPVGVDF